MDLARIKHKRANLIFQIDYRRNAKELMKVYNI